MKKILLLIIVISFILCSCIGRNKSESEYSVEKVADGFQFIEGPVWVNGTGLLFSDIPANKVYLYESDKGTSVYLEDSGNSNGLTLDETGAVLLAQHGLRQIARLDKTGTFESLASMYEGKKLNSPNDLTLHSSGSIFFTDPPFGLMDKNLKSDLGFSGIYRIDSDGSLFLLNNELDLPNGIAFNSDESVLYVNDSREHTIYRWNVLDDLTLSEKSEFARIPVSGYADGMKIDNEGNLYVTGPDGVWIFSPDGGLLDHVSIPGQGSASNCAWGDEDGQSLYVTANYALYRIRRIN